MTLSFFMTTLLFSIISVAENAPYKLPFVDMDGIEPEFQSHDSIRRFVVTSGYMADEGDIMGAERPLLAVRQRRIVSSRVHGGFPRVGFGYGRRTLEQPPIAVIASFGEKK